MVAHGKYRGNLLPGRQLLLLQRLQLGLLVVAERLAVVAMANIEAISYLGGSCFSSSASSLAFS